MLDFLSKIYKKNKGVWKYADFYAEKISVENRLVIGDGGTELLENRDINKILNSNTIFASPLSLKGRGGNADAPNPGREKIRLYFKREDRNETGSLKGRSLAYQVSLNKQRGAKALVISTSGNAGIAAAAYVKAAGMKLFVFISPDTEKGKVADMQKYNPVIIKSKRAIRFANYVAVKYKLPNLRPSVDDDSIEGFKSIAFEIADKAGDVDAVFTFVTSGSSFIGMYRGFEAYLNAGEIKNIPKMYAVQSGKIFSVAEEFEENGCLIVKENYDKGGEISAGQLGVKNTKRKKEILGIVHKTGGRGIYVSEIEIEKARRVLAEHKIETSLEGCASFAGFIKMQNTQKFKKAVCILSGKLRGGKGNIGKSKIYNAESFEEVDEIVGGGLKV